MAVAGDTRGLLGEPGCRCRTSIAPHAFCRTRCLSSACTVSASTTACHGPSNRNSRRDPTFSAPGLALPKPTVSHPFHSPTRPLADETNLPHHRKLISPALLIPQYSRSKIDFQRIGIVFILPTERLNRVRQAHLDLAEGGLRRHRSQTAGSRQYVSADESSERSHYVREGRRSHQRRRGGLSLASWQLLR